MKYNSQKIKNAADSIRKVLFNYDLEMTASIGELKICKAKVQRYKNPKTKREKEIYVNARINEEKLNVFIQQLTDGKNETWQALEDVLQTYTPRYKTIWLMYFISQYTYEEIAQKTNYSIDGVKFIVKKLKGDLINLGLIEEDEGD